MKTKTILFGAGQGSIKFRNNTAESRDFVAYLDNSEAKSGTLFEGVPVYTPDALAQLEYDEIVITTQWSMDVYEQLVNELGIPEHKVLLPEKKLMKNQEPFQNPNSLALARTIITEISRYAIEAEVPIVVDFGTLLGIIRDGDIIPWDDDVDLSVPVAQGAQAKAVLQQFVQNNNDADWFITEVKDNESNVVGLWLKFHTTDQDELTAFTTSLCFREEADEQSHHMPSLGLWFAPEEHFQSFDVICWQNHEIQVPAKVEDYLTFVYKQWQTPKKDIKLSDYANLNKVDFEHIIEASFKSTILGQE